MGGTIRMSGITHAPVETPKVVAKSPKIKKGKKR